jgi:predicted nucleic acid-binding protein
MVRPAERRASRAAREIRVDLQPHAHRRRRGRQPRERCYLAALAIEYGATVVTFGRDFSRFSDVEAQSPFGSGR